MRDMPKEKLYNGVKTLVEASERYKHFHLPQQKLFTLFSVAFQYMLFRSTKEAGAYIVRIEDSSLAEKLAKRSKDPSTRRFVQSLLLPRKVKYGKSTFFLDFFHLGSWNLTNEIPKEKLKAAIVVKNTSSRPMMEIDTEEEEEKEAPMPGVNLPEDYYLSSLVDNVPNTIAIALEQGFGNYNEMERIEFDFIPKEEERIKGVTLAKGLNLDFNE
jgi:hypothetical protein